MATLQPVYQQIKDIPDEEIAMDDLARSPETKEDSKESNGCDSCPSSDKKCCKEGRPRSLARRLCTCACGFVVFGLFLWVIGGAAFVSYLSIKTYRCVHPRHQVLTTFTFDDKEVKEFDIGVVSGFINVRTCPMADKITMNVYRRASSPELIQTMPVEKSLQDGVFKINVLSPSFDFQHCQSASIDLIIPQKWADKLHLILKAQTILGKITVDAPHHVFDKISLYANLGLVKADHVVTQNALELEARVGCAHAGNTKSKSIALRSSVGGVCAQNIKAEVAEIEVATGRASLSYLDVVKATITSELGWVSVWALGNVESLEARVDYGRLNVSPDRGWGGKFTVDSPYGWLDVTHAKNANAPVLEKNTPAVISGKYALNADAKEVSVLNMKATYAAINLFLPPPLVAVPL